MSPDPGDSSRKHGAEEQLEAAGYEPALKREFNFIQGASIGFADISPIVSLYGVFGLALAAAGPPMFWGLILVYAAMLLVALVFAEVSSVWPLAGGSISGLASRSAPGSPGLRAGRMRGQA